MKHFKSEMWADLVRNVVSEPNRVSMQAHLDDGCESCTAEWNTWKRVARVASNEKQYEPPSDAMHQALTQFALHRPEPATTGVKHIAALVMDSFKAPAMVGVRSAAAAASTARQLLYQQGSCVIDVRVEMKHGSTKVSIIGQVQDTMMVESDFRKVSVCVLSGNHLVMHTTTNNTGEFHLECEAVEKLSLQVGLEGKSIVLPIPDLSVSTSGKRT